VGVSVTVAEGVKEMVKEVDGEGEPDRVLVAVTESSGEGEGDWLVEAVDVQLVEALGVME